MVSRFAVPASRPLPDHALLARYAADGGYTDCFAAEIAGIVPFTRYVEAFYTTPLFRLERRILSLALSLPSSDAQVREFAEGSRDSFAAWHLEARAENQLLLCDVYGATRSWLMVEPMPDTGRTRLYFGSAAVPRAMRRASFRLLLGLHIFYSKALLRAAWLRLR